jgi:hypothetical protein
MTKRKYSCQKDWKVPDGTGGFTKHRCRRAIYREKLCVKHYFEKLKKEILTEIRITGSHVTNVDRHFQQLDVNDLRTEIIEFKRKCINRDLKYFYQMNQTVHKRLVAKQKINPAISKLWSVVLRQRIKDLRRTEGKFTLLLLKLSYIEKEENRMLKEAEFKAKIFSYPIGEPGIKDGKIVWFYTGRIDRNKLIELETERRWNSNRYKPNFKTIYYRPVRKNEKTGIYEYTFSNEV